MDDNDINRRYSGLIAQEVQNVIPEVIDVRHDGKLRLLYTNLAGLFVESIKELDENNKKLEKKINLIINCGLGLSFIFIISVLFNTKTNYIFYH